MARRRTLWISISLLSLVLAGTFLVLSAVRYYFAIGDAAYLAESDLGSFFNDTRRPQSNDVNAHTHANPSQHSISQVERIPRIIHQTWKSETLPDRWIPVVQGCKDMNPDYEYILWTDASSREFIAKHYPWFLGTYDGYEYGIQRADAIRYFILHHHGGIYMDLDIGCERPLDPLLVYPVILPKTIPVGVSNDLMFSEKGHPFMAQTIHNLVTFDHSWFLNYPTVMFSTGPMFLSAQYGLWTASHPVGPEYPDAAVRILPKSLYGKNAKDGEAPHSFFTHFYGSSWHADDAGFVRFLGNWGRGVMFVMAVVIAFGLLRLTFPGRTKRKSYEVVLPRWSARSGRWRLDVRWFTMPGGAALPSAPVPLDSSEPTYEDGDMVSLPLSSLPFDLRSRPPSPDHSEISGFLPSKSDILGHPVVDSVVAFGSRLIATLRGSKRCQEEPRTSSRGRRARPQVLFMPTIFTSDSEAPSRRHSRSRSPPPRYPTSPSFHPSEKEYEHLDLESRPSGSVNHSRESTALPGYALSSRAAMPGNDGGDTPGLLTTFNNAGISRPSSRAS